MSDTNLSVIGDETGLRTFETEWFNIGASGSYTLEHNLGLEAPWRCFVRVLGKMIKAEGGWAIGDILFCDGVNYNGQTTGREIGWALSLSENTVHVSFGNETAFMYNKKTGSNSVVNKSSVKCKLIINY